MTGCLSNILNITGTNTFLAGCHTVAWWYLLSGKVRLKLYKGNIIKAGVWSDYSLYSEEIATFGEDNVYNQADSAGFINLYGLPIKVQAMVDKMNEK